jgi:dual specificity MAP kinase phosphatase
MINDYSIPEKHPIYYSATMQVEKEDDLSFLHIRQNELEQRNVLISQEMQALSFTIEKKRLSAQLSDRNMHRIFEDIYLGNCQAYIDWIQQAQETPNQFYSVISVANIAAEVEIPHNVEHLSFDISDGQVDWSSQDGIRGKLKDVFQFIDQARIKERPLLIHCLAGRSRSVTFLTAYLMWSCRQRYENVSSFIQSKRWQAVPSDELRRVLSENFQQILITKGILN